jgi:hypothetical protein
MNRHSKAIQNPQSVGAGACRGTGRFTTKVATPEQVRKADILLARLKEEAKKTGWMPYYPHQPEVP